ncbi:hypothetical protein LUZ61_003975 [Rhynchospora tenuis]|uniref:non-specific serine/threonine protein kinase n=1 Tax=Rhynchospora tenuis TaxID=198213 RepID=A0AAD6ETD1_9POAL|nr:hypothetical protein LUZ61_003975 [Rhynchospora tenuis]
MGNFSNHVFAVEFDTNKAYKLFNDPDDNHVGIDINSLKSNISEKAAYYSENSTKVDFELEMGQPIQSWIDYNGTTKVISVAVAPLLLPKPSQPLISYFFDLLPIMKNEMYVGLTSATGKLSSFHYILAWSFSTDRTAQAIDLSSLPKLLQSASTQSGSRATTVKIGLVSAVATFAFMIILIIVSLYLWKRAKLADNTEEWELDYPHRLEYKELYRATKGFNETELIGSGGFGHVYKGELWHTKEVVAVKKILNNARQGVREFVTEISSLGKMRHQNLVELRGWCKRNEDLIIVYEFMPNGSLDTHLSASKDNTRAILSWEQRLKILKGVASGLLYLHEEWGKVVVHRNIKSSNVLLGLDMTPKLGDFGLAKLYEHGTKPNTTRAAGTLGYMAPELLHMGKATTCSDVFVFGVLLLEVVCGRRPIELSAPENELDLVAWVRDCEVCGELMEVIITGWETSMIIRRWRWC